MTPPTMRRRICDKCDCFHLETEWCPREYGELRHKLGAQLMDAVHKAQDTGASAGFPVFLGHEQRPRLLVVVQPYYEPHSKQ